MLVSKMQHILKLLHTIAPRYNLRHLFVRRHEVVARLSELNAMKEGAEFANVIIEFLEVV